VASTYTTRRAVPASFFGMPLGLVALGIAWQSATSVWALPHQIGATLIFIGSALWAYLFILYIAKWMQQRAAAEAEFEDPVQCCFVGLAGVVASLSSIGFAPYSPRVSLTLFALGAAWTIVFAVYRTGRLWMGGRSPETSTPVLYLPTVAGSFVSASAAAAQGHADWGQLLFGAGLFGWLAVESVLLHRLYTAEAMPPPLRPTLGIQLAPPAVAAVAYLNVGGGHPDLFAHALIGYALLQGLILLRLWPWLKAAGATPAWWGFSFGAAALPTAAIKLLAQGDGGPVSLMAPALFVVGNLVIVIIGLITIRLAVRGRLLPAPSVPS
jgi:tellurite resistance protein